MPLQPSMKLPSVDDHVIEHPMVWADWRPNDGCGPEPAYASTGAEHAEIGEIKKSLGDLFVSDQRR
jgi:hypothetical protein